MNFLVTGGAGFIGSHLAERLLDQGHRVHVLDDLSTGSLENLAACRGRRGFEATTASVFDERVLARAVARADAVVHLAAAVGVMLVVESPVHTIHTNIAGTAVVLRHAARSRTPVLIASSSEVYGKGVRVPFREEDDSLLGPPTRSRWVYAASKLVDEYIALSYWREKGLPVTIARFFNTVGPRQTGRYGMVLPRFVEQGLRGGPITVYGDGRQTRCFAHVDDVVGAVVGLLGERRARGGVFNVGSDEEISIGALARLVRRKTDPAAEIRRVPYDRAYAEGFEDLRRRVPDLSRIRKLIRYRPRHDIESIVDSVVGDARKRLTQRGKPWRRH